MLNTLWKGSAPLTVTGLVMIVVLVAAAVGLAVDPRIITGAPAWLKPSKFAISIAIYSFTLAWIFTLLPEWPRVRRVVGWTTAVALVLEIALISLQAFRGTASHFNVGTVFDGVVFAVMGIAIVIQTLATIAVAVALWRHRFTDRALGWALRLGMTLTIVGAMTGGMMTRPTTTQLDAARAGERLTVVGAHTVGGPDGGPGLPVVGWSTQHGDIRVAHFLGLHALQVLPIVALLARRRVNDAIRVRLTIAAAASYAGLFAILLSAALRGQSVLVPDAPAVMLLGAWLFTTIAVVAAAFFRRQAAGRPALV
jgi:hypothetical protein